MGMSTGSAGQTSVKSEPNVVLMIDIMLVLLIIFMIVTPLLAAGFKATLPKGDNLADRPGEENEVGVGVDVGLRLAGQQDRNRDEQEGTHRDRGVGPDGTDRYLYAARPARAMLRSVARQLQPAGDVRRFGQRAQSGVLAGKAGLGQGVLDKGAVRLLGLAHAEVGLAHQLHAQGGQHGLQFGELAAVVGCQYDFHNKSA